MRIITNLPTQKIRTVDEPPEIIIVDQPLETSEQREEEVKKSKLCPELNAEIELRGRHWTNPARFKMMCRMYDVLKNMNIDPVPHGLAATPGKQGLEELTEFLDIQNNSSWTQIEAKLRRWASSLQKSLPQKPIPETHAPPLARGAKKSKWFHSGHNESEGRWIQYPLTLAAIAKCKKCSTPTVKVDLAETGLIQKTRQGWTVRVDNINTTVAQKLEKLSAVEAAK